MRKLTIVSMALAVMLALSGPLYAGEVMSYPSTDNTGNWHWDKDHPALKSDINYYQDQMNSQKSWHANMAEQHPMAVKDAHFHPSTDNTGNRHWIKDSPTIKPTSNQSGNQNNQLSWNADVAQQHPMAAKDARFYPSTNNTGNRHWIKDNPALTTASNQSGIQVNSNTTE